MYSYLDIKEVLENADNSQDLSEFINVIDELFLTGEIVLSDDEWNRFTSDIERRLDLLEGYRDSVTYDS